MVTYIIASKANNQFLAEVTIYILNIDKKCQALGEFLEANCNDCCVKTVIKHKDEWADFLDSVTLFTFIKTHVGFKKLWL
jgi:hypothetical protein